MSTVTATYKKDIVKQRRKLLDSKVADLRDLMMTSVLNLKKSLVMATKCRG